MEIETQTSNGFHFRPTLHPHIRAHQTHQPVKVADQAAPNLNGKIALLLTRGVGTMWCAYAFAALALIALPQALGSPLTLIEWLSQTFIQLVMLSVIMVGQNLLSAASDQRAEDTWKDADATFHTAEEIQQHLSLQDRHLIAQDARLEQLITALCMALPNVAAELAALNGEEGAAPTQ